MAVIAIDASVALMADAVKFMRPPRSTLPVAAIVALADKDAPPSVTSDIARLEARQHGHDLRVGRGSRYFFNPRETLCYIVSCNIHD